MYIPKWGWRNKEKNPSNRQRTNTREKHRKKTGLSSFRFQACIQKGYSPFCLRSLIFRQPTNGNNAFMTKWWKNRMAKANKKKRAFASNRTTPNGTKGWKRFTAAWWIAVIRIFRRIIVDTIEYRSNAIASAVWRIHWWFTEKCSNSL